MLAFRNTTVTKDAVLAQLQAHAAADELIKGQYWSDGKGCAVGCTIHSGDHAEYEPRFGIPRMLAKLEDRIFEGLPNGTAKAWPIRFMSAVRPGADLSCVGWQFLHWLLTDEQVNPGINHPTVRDAVKQCAGVLLPLSKGEAADESAAESAAASAESAESAESAASAGRSAAWSAARSAARSAESAASTESEAYVRMADKLVELIGAAPISEAA